MTRTPLAVLLLLALSTSRSLAQDYHLEVPALPEYGDGGLYERIQFLDYRGNFRQGCAILRDGHMIVSADTRGMEAFAHLGLSDVEDFDVLPIEGDARTALVLTKTGAPRIYTPASDPFAIDPFDYVTLNSLALSGARLVRVGELTGDNLPDLCFVGANSRSVYLVPQLAGGTWGMPQQIHYAIRPVQQLELAKLDAVGGAEILLRTNLTLDVLSSTGTLLHRITSLVDPSHDLLHVARDVNGQDLALFVTRTDSGSPEQTLMVLDEVGLVDSLPLGTSTDVRNLASGRIDGDDYVDVVLSLASGTNRVIVLHNQSSNGLDLDPGDTTTIDMTPTEMPPAGSHHVIAVNDLDRNEGLDIVSLSDSSGWMNVKLDYFDTGILPPVGGGIGDLSDSSFGYVYDDDWNVPGQGSTMGILLSLGIDVATHNLSNNISANSLEVITWKRVPWDADYMENMAYSRCDDFGLPPGGGPMPLKLPELFLPFEIYDAFAFEIRAVRLNGQGSVVWAGPSIFGYFAWDAGAFSTDLIDNDDGGACGENPCQFSVSDKGTGFLGEVLRVPRFAPGSFPIDGVICRQPNHTH